MVKTLKIFKNVQVLQCLNANIKKFSWQVENIKTT